MSNKLKLFHSLAECRGWGLGRKIDCWADQKHFVFYALQTNAHELKVLLEGWLYFKVSMPFSFFNTNKATVLIKTVSPPYQHSWGHQYWTLKYANNWLLPHMSQLWGTTGPDIISTMSRINWRINNPFYVGPSEMTFGPTKAGNYVMS